MTRFTIFWTFLFINWLFINIYFQSSILHFILFIFLVANLYYLSRFSTIILTKRDLWIIFFINALFLFLLFMVITVTIAFIIMMIFIICRFFLSFFLFLSSILLGSNHSLFRRIFLVHLLFIFSDIFQLFIVYFYKLILVYIRGIIIVTKKPS